MDAREIKSRLIIIEQEKMKVFYLDDKVTWKIGRVSAEEFPDIELVTPTISRPHGVFKNKGGIWIYSDFCKLNGTTYNGKLITIADNHKILEDGDIFVFGGHGKSVINEQTVWGIYLKRELGEGYCIEDTSRKKVLVFTDGITNSKFVRPDKGTVVVKDRGLGIYMGDVTYLLGDIRLA